MHQFAELLIKIRGDRLQHSHPFSSFSSTHYISCAFLLFPHRPPLNSSSFVSASVTRSRPLQVLRSFRRRTKCSFLSVLQLSAFSERLEKSSPHWEQQEQRVRRSFTTWCLQSVSSVTLTSRITRVSPAGVCKASRHVHGVCRAVAWRYLYEESEAAVQLLRIDSENHIVENSCHGISHRRYNPSFYI